MIKFNKEILKTMWNKLFIPFIAMLITVGSIFLLWSDIKILFSSISLTMWLIALFGFLFFMFNELEDESVRSTWNKYKKFLNSNISWKNKWELDDNNHLIINNKKQWYYFRLYPKYKERFYLSSTVLVWLTDGEHLFQFLKKRSIDIAFLIISWKFMLSWITGVIIFSFIKEKFLKSIQ